MASSDIVLSAALRSNLLSLQNTQSNIDKTQLRLATGLKVNSALDNPQSYFTAQSLKNRASDLSQLLDGLSLSIQSINEANTGVTSLTKLVQQAQSVAENAQSAANAAAGFASIKSTVDLNTLTGPIGTGVLRDNVNINTNDSFSVNFYSAATGNKTANIIIGNNYVADNIVADINSSANLNPYITASVNPGGELQIVSKVDGGIIRIAPPSAGAAISAAGLTRLGLNSLIGQENITNTTRQGGTVIAGTTVKSAVAAAVSQVNGQYIASAVLNTAGYTTTGANNVVANISIDGKTSANITLTATSTIQNFLDGVNTDATLAGKVTATFDTTTGQISLTGADGTQQLKVNFLSAGGASVNFGFGDAQANAVLAANDQKGEIFNFVGNSADLSSYQTDYNSIRTQIDGLIQDANFQGVNLLGGDNLTTFFNENRSNSLVTTGVDFSALGLGLSKGNFQSATTVQTAIDQTQAALSAVRTFGTKIANDLSIIQTRQDFTNQTINTLKAGADVLTVADQNEEGANLLALQTRQQLGVTSLSLASQSQQSVLKLF